MIPQKPRTISSSFSIALPFAYWSTGLSASRLSHPPRGLPLRGYGAYSVRTNWDFISLRKTCSVSAHDTNDHGRQLFRMARPPITLEPCLLRRHLLPALPLLPRLPGSPPPSCGLNRYLLAVRVERLVRLACSFCRRNPSCFTILLIAFPGVFGCGRILALPLATHKILWLPQPAANHIYFWETANFA